MSTSFPTIDFDAPLLIQQVKSHFLDSGSFTLWSKAKEWAKKHSKSEEAYYETVEFYAYLDAYVAFIKKNKGGIDFYANVDAIGWPEITLRNQKYLKAKGLTPVPVIHYRTEMKWIKRYMEDHEFIALGGMAKVNRQANCQRWIDRAFSVICDGKGLPRVKVHGFGITVYDLLLRYPWWSVDSTRWTKEGGFGKILLPHKRQGKFVFDEQPYLVPVSMESPQKDGGYHFTRLSALERKIVEEWLESINIPLGKVNRDGSVLEYGVVTRHIERRAANIRFFERMREWLPDWPWPFVAKKRKGFGLVP